MVDLVLWGTTGADDIFPAKGEWWLDLAIFGDAGNDFLRGGYGDDVLLGGNGNDILEGNDGDDQLLGGNGNDDMLGGSGDDVLVGGNGIDHLVGGYGTNHLDGGSNDANYSDFVDYGFYSPTSNLGVYVNLAAGRAWNIGSVRVIDDVLIDIEAVQGSAKVDIMIAHAVKDSNLYGMEGNDIILGGAGSDVFFGGLGADLLRGSGGADIFAYQSVIESNAAFGRDTIADFQPGRDIIQLVDIDASLANVGDQAFSWRGNAGFGGVQGELHYRHTGAGNTAKTVVEGDVNGDRIADFQIYLIGHNVLSDSDFLL